MRKLFYGAWNLISQSAYRRHGSNSETYYPRSADAIGRIMYDESGAMSVHLINPHATFTDWTSYEAAMTGYLGYFGTFHVDEEAKIVTHEIEGSTYSGFIQENQKRQSRVYAFNADGTQLTLMAETELETRVLVWQRLGQVQN